MALILLWRQTSQLHEVALKPGLERFTAMDRNGNPHNATRLGVDVVAAIDALQRPSAWTPASGRTPCRRAPSQRQFDDLVIGVRGPSLHWNRQTSFDGFTQIEPKLFHRLALCGATGDGWHFGPESAFFGFVHEGVNLHSK